MSCVIPIVIYFGIILGGFVMNKIYFTAQEVSELLGVSRGQSYKIVQQLNSELSQKGFITVAGKVPKKYFSERYYGGIEEKEAEV